MLLKEGSDVFDAFVKQVNMSPRTLDFCSDESGLKSRRCYENFVRTFFEASLLRSDIVILLVNRGCIEAREAFGEDRLEVCLLFVVAQHDRWRRNLNGRD